MKYLGNFKYVNLGFEIQHILGQLERLYEGLELESAKKRHWCGSLRRRPPPAKVHGLARCGRSQWLGPRN